MLVYLHIMNYNLTNWLSDTDRHHIFNVFQSWPIFNFIIIKAGDAPNANPHTYNSTKWQAKVCIQPEHRSSKHITNSSLHEVLQPASVGAVCQHALCILLRVCEQKQGYSDICNVTNTPRENTDSSPAWLQKPFTVAGSFSSSVVNCKTIWFFEGARVYRTLCRLGVFAITRTP